MHCRAAKFASEWRLWIRSMKRKRRKIATVILKAAICRIYLKGYFESWKSRFFFVFSQNMDMEYTKAFARIRKVDKVTAAWKKTLTSASPCVVRSLSRYISIKVRSIILESFKEVIQKRKRSFKTTEKLILFHLFVLI